MSFRLKTILGIALIETVLLVILIVSGINFLSNSNEQQLHQRAETTLRLFASATKDAVLATDLATLESFVAEVLDNPDVVYIRISTNNTPLAEGGDKTLLAQRRQTDHQVTSVNDGVFDVTTDIMEGDTHFGKIEMGLSTSYIDQLLAEAKRWTISIAGLEVILVAVFSFVLGTYLTRQLKGLKVGSEIVAKAGPGHQIPVSGNDELAEVASAFNSMSASLQQNYDELQVSLSSQQKMVALAKRNEAKNKAILSASLDAMITIDTDGHIIDYNQVAEDVFGWSHTEVIAKPMADLIIPQRLRQAHLKGMAHYLKTGEGPALGHRLELTALHKNGHEFPVEIAISPIETDQGPLFTAFIRDISERLAAETELRLAAQAFETSEAMFITDADVKIIRCNSAFTRITGYAEAEVIGCNPGSVFKSGIHDAEFYRAMWSEIQENGEWHGEICNKRKSGEIFPEYLNISAVKGAEDKVTHYIAHFIDITEQKNNEAYLKQARRDAESANEAKSRFLAAMSHEIRTPMNGVLGILGLLRDTSLNETQRHYVRTGRESSEHLLSIMNDILDFSKMEADKMVLEQIDFDLHYLFSSTIELLTPQADKKNLTLTLSLDENLPNHAKGDPDRLRQILINLLGNAIKFTDQGHISVDVSTAKTDNWLTLQCAVKDTGIGIAPELQLALFDEFTMADQTHSRSHEGTGLGLAICRRLTNLMGGNITVDSEPGKGSIFHFNVKLGFAESAITTTHQTHDTCEQLPDSDTRILLAEDNPANQMVVKNMLEHSGLQVDIVANGQEAVDTIRTLPYDIVLMDISMPDMDGITATQEIRRLSGSAAKTPIIALTAHALSGDRERFIAAGMDDYLAKPINRMAMLNCIAYWANSKRSKHTAPSTITVQEDLDTADNPGDLVDESVLQQLCRDTAPDVVPELLMHYIEDGRRLVTGISSAAAAQDFKKLEFDSHTLGSSAAAHSNIQLHKLARQIEYACQENEHEQSLNLATSLPALAKQSFELLANRAEKGF